MDVSIVLEKNALKNVLVATLAKIFYNILFWLR